MTWNVRNLDGIEVGLSGIPAGIEVRFPVGSTWDSLWDRSGIPCGIEVGFLVGSEVGFFVGSEVGFLVGSKWDLFWD